VTSAPLEAMVSTLFVLGLSAGRISGTRDLR
jgi:hypothetical protein